MITTVWAVAYGITSWPLMQVFRLNDYRLVAGDTGAYAFLFFYWPCVSMLAM
jgi:hypothetical protein